MNAKILPTYLLRTRALIFNIPVVAAFSFFAHGSFKAQADEIKLKVGVISGLTGAAAKWSAFQNKGMELAVEDLKREGVDIDLVFEDSQTQATKVISAYNKLRQLDRVDVLIANDFGLVIAPLLPHVERYDTPLLALWLPQEMYCKSAPRNFVSMSSQVKESAPAYDRFFELHPEVKRVGLVAFDEPGWGQAYLQIWRELAAKRGVQVVDTFVNNEWQPDFKTALTKMISKTPDAIFFAHEPEGLVKAARQLGFSKPLVAANNLLEMLAGSKRERAELEGVYVVDPEVSLEFRDKFIARFNLEPILEAYAGYEAVRTIAQAAKIDRTALSLSMRRVKYRGIAGEIDFTKGTCAGNQAEWGLFKFDKSRRAKQ
jgi:branched-chain amino acid transport system substrate-binding protein